MWSKFDEVFFLSSLPYFPSPFVYIFRYFFSLSPVLYCTSLLCLSFSGCVSLSLSVSLFLWLCRCLCYPYLCVSLSLAMSLSMLLLSLYLCLSFSGCVSCLRHFTSVAIYATLIFVPVILFFLPLKETVHKHGFKSNLGRGMI